MYLCGREGVQGEGWWWRSQYYWNNKKIWNIGWFFLSNMFWMFWRTSPLPRKVLNTYWKHLIALIFATVAGARCTFPLNIVCIFVRGIALHQSIWKIGKSGKAIAKLKVEVTDSYPGKNSRGFLNFFSAFK